MPPVGPQESRGQKAASSENRNSWEGGCIGKRIRWPDAKFEVTGAKCDLSREGSVLDLLHEQLTDSNRVCMCVWSSEPSE